MAFYARFDSVKAKIVLTDETTVNVESQPGADPAKAIKKIREILEDGTAP